ncbi:MULTISPECIES: histidine phosphatase family protein [unclassified Modestobacter]|uniref:histidine phosphatase family protein n=1 Tax=unclassified Modestobacter TaxID=2643866 RepID=UPI0022AA3F14|nr:MULTISPECIES: histidine phosphatase family protein [unclassified Modestobacter]MCZ2824542.1 histidine phosphatase family protein [Modestobacter sp. VKM Ac-2981]MCZ2853930.1 histidine phosphatase family protein [Modestobacter sp. VKM Ac-2982]
MTGGADAPAVSRLLVWRHGRTEWNAAGRFQGQLDPPLDAEGRSQAARTAPHLATLLTGQETLLVSSDLQRAVDTAEALAPLLGVPLRIDERLREHGLGSWEGLTRHEVADRHPGQYADWMAGRPVPDRGGEAQADVAARALAAVADLPPAATAVLVTHGGTAGRLIEALLGLGAEHKRVFGPLGNCHWSELSFQASGWRLMRHNLSALAPERMEGGVRSPGDRGPFPELSATDAPDAPRAGASPEEGAPLTDADAG